MVQDIRDIVLSLDEVLAAFEGYQRIQPDFMPKGKITGCRIVPDGVAVTIDMAYGGLPQSSEVIFKGVDVLKPLIRFCIENNIMLPRDGKKSVVISNTTIAMHVELDLNIDMPTFLNPIQARGAEKSGEARSPADIIASRSR